MSEPFTWDVVGLASQFLSCSDDTNTSLAPPQAYSTSLEQIEQLRSLMLAFLQDQRRDYLSLFDVFVVGASLLRQVPCSSNAPLSWLVIVRMCYRRYARAE